MDFFDQQENARRKTGRLIVMFAIAVVMIVCAVNLAAYGIMRAGDTYSSTKRSFQFDRERNRLFDPHAPGEIPLFRRPEPYIGITLLTLGIITCGSMFKIAMLARGGGTAVAQLMGGRRISNAAPAPDEKILQNVVEEMAIASGVPVPQIFVMDQEDGINAFAAGFSPSDAIVCVTRGCLQHLSRDELQGVIAHEFSHILNGDMRTNIKLMGVLNGILVIGLLGYAMLRSVQFMRGSRNDRGGQIVLLILVGGVALFVIGYVGLFFGRLIQAAVSRQREFLADASAVQFTRNPLGLAGALKKIAQFSGGSNLNNPHSLEVAHLFFATGSKIGLSGLLATHPPLAERIRRLDPTFKGDFAIGPGATDVLNETSDARRGDVLASMLSGSVARPIMPVTAAQIVNQAGSAPPRAVHAAAQLIASIPPAIARAAHDPFSARATAIALLVSDDPALGSNQLQRLHASLDPASVNEALKLAPAILQLDDATHIALMDLVQPALRQLSSSQLHELALAAKGLIEADGRVTLFEYAMHRQLKRCIDSSEQSKTPRPIAYTSLSPLLHDVVTVLSALAYSGNDDATAAAAFRAGVARLEVADQLSIAYSRDLKAVDLALNRLADASPAVKRRVIDAVAHTIAEDSVIRPEEAALLRAICAAMDVPLPMMG